jgi:hypothetical protein
MEEQRLHPKHLMLEMSLPWNREKGK